MNRSRLASIALISAAALALAGCGGEETAGPTSSAPSASASAAAPTSAAASPSVAPSSPAAGRAPVTVNEKMVCESAEKAGQDMKKVLIAAVQSGKEPSADVYRKMLTGLHDKLAALAPEGADGKVAAAVNQMGAEAAKAAAAGDPASAADNPAFEKAGTDLTAACKTVGVKVNF